MAGVQPPARPIVFLSDFGLDDEFVGICHGVMARISPWSRVIDLTHGVPPQDVRRGALILADSVPYVPEDSVFLGVVDPGVGTDRKALGIETSAGQLLVGPDNGILSLAWDRLGGAVRAVEIRSADVQLPSPSRTFHGRDVFAPAAAHLASGVGIGDLGPSLDPGGLVSVDVGRPEVAHGRIHAEVLGVDRFGNVQLNVDQDDIERAALGETLSVRTVWRAVPVRRASTFGEAEPGEFAAVIDSRGHLAVVKDGGSAAGSLRLSLGDHVVIEGSG